MADIKTEEKKKKNRDNFKKWYANNDNRDKHISKLMAIVTCECGRHVTKGNMLKHKSTKMHAKLMKQRKIIASVRKYKELVKENKALLHRVLELETA